MGDVGTGLRNFKRGMNKDNDEEASEPKPEQIEVTIEPSVERPNKNNKKMPKN